MLKNKDKEKLERSRAASRARKTTLRTKYTGCRSNAVIREIPFDLTYAEYEKFLTKNNLCGYCDTDLLTIGGSSLDRIDNSQGYRLGNVIPCCGPCNQIRGDNLTVFEMQVAMNAVIEYRKSLKPKP
jgi:hypothetical protein